MASSKTNTKKAKAKKKTSKKKTSKKNNSQAKVSKDQKPSTKRSNFKKYELRKTQIFKDIRNIQETENSLSFTYYGNLTKLRRLKTIIAVYVVKNFVVPRPKALLGHEHWTQLLIFLKEIKQLDSFKNFRFSAAGKDSVVFHRFELPKDHFQLEIGDSAIYLAV